jgi:branched-subunit amino acid transport protein
MTAYDLLTILVTAAAVYLPKAVPLFALGERMPSSVRRWLDYIAPAVLAALVAPQIVLADHTLATPRPAHAALLATFAVALITRRMLPPVAIGIGVLIALTLLATMTT